MRKLIFVAICGFVMLAGCGWAGQTALNEPQPIMPPSDTTLDVLGQVGDSPAIRCETQAYSGLQQNSFTEVGSDTDPDVSPDGKLLVFASTRHARTSDVFQRLCSYGIIREMPGKEGRKRRWPGIKVGPEAEGWPK